MLFSYKARSGSFERKPTILWRGERDFYEVIYLKEVFVCAVKKGGKKRKNPAELLICGKYYF